MNLSLSVADYFEITFYVRKAYKKVRELCYKLLW